MPSKKHDYSALRVIASPDGLVVQDANRKAVTGIIGVDISLRPGKTPLMRVNMVSGHFDVVGQPIFAIADPADGRPRPVARVEFCDGQVFEAPPLPAQPVAPEGTPVAAPIQPANPQPQPDDGAPAKPNGGGVGG